MVLQSRRRFLQASTAVGTLAVAGCLGTSGTAKDSAQRQIEPPVQPEPGTWPTTSYDAENTRYNPNASPPRSTPTTEWSVSLSGVVSDIVVGPDYVYASSDEETVAFAHDGSKQWQLDIGGRLTYVANRLYLSADTVIALDATSGQELWRGPTDGPTPGGVYETTGTVYVTGRRSVQGLHPDTGSERWRLETDRGVGLVADERRVGVVTNAQVRFIDPGEAVDGFLREPKPRTVETIRTGWRPDVLSPTLLDNTLYVSQYGDTVSDVQAAARRYDLVYTDERWVTPFTWAGVGAIAVDADHVFAAPFRATTDPPDGSIVALDRRTGVEQWRYDGSMLGSPVVGGNVVVAGGADPGSPSVCVSSDAESNEDCTNGESPAESGVLRAFDAETGERLWAIEPGASYGSYSLALTEDRIYYGDATGVHTLA